MARAADDVHPQSDDISEVERFDLDVAAEASAQRRHPLVRLAGKASELADQPQLATICGLVVAAGLVQRDVRLTRAGLRMSLAFALATGAKGWLKNRIDRTRPNAALDEGRYRMRPGGDRDGKDRSFPSGHTAGAVAVAGALATEFPRAAVPAFGVAGLVAAIQIPRGAHYPSDLAGGLAVGLAAAALAGGAFAAFDRAAARRRTC